MEKINDSHEILIHQLQVVSNEISDLKSDITTFKVDIAVLKKDLEGNQKLTQWMMGLYAAGFAVVFAQLIERILK